MTLLIVFFALLALILLVTWGKCNAFLAFLVVSIATGLCLGIPADKITRSVQKGIGDTLGSLVVIIMLGAMLGKLVAASGAAKRITDVLMKAFGEKNIQWALMVTGFIVGIPLFYNVGFVLMVPLIFSVVYQYKLPAVYIGLPMLASLSVTHGFLPPHPSPSALVGQFNANMGLTLLYGFVIAIPTIIVAGPVFARTLKNINSVPLKTFQPPVLNENEMPGSANSFLSSLLPVLLLATTALLPLLPAMQRGFWPALLAFVGDPITVMLLSVIVATFTLGIANGKSMKDVMDIYGDAVKDVAMIVLIVAGAGVLKQVLVDSGVSNAIAAQLQNWPIPPLVLGWLIAAVLRVCIGSATVAGLTTAGIVAPTITQLNVEPNLMVLSIGAGSLMFSHVNDAGFWLYKEYFNLSIKDTLRSWSLMETIVAVMGLLGVLLLNLVV
ncbi:gluconate:H+ symporter [Pseudobacter ginsenosidimutans]|jgi:Gnt-I system high-affinity gluconate transporter|uniref:Gnt-I system high-affinity gluconate transporter n=1 Tax=Pseudobacter ginsenosidimutans TaxID=661488 RepID=A0A4Q7MDL3_9BACT|nr:gluconate:H+ symporter [Pseudobacter ginsenosidimutans]QEC42783.1 gluconate transporter [Pseudobacter ginsenosidimutans]RZS65058.1 Gnt-I system high-affinity gluconate transporter [Pseudobacter ginsenosidimutans]